MRKSASELADGTGVRFTFLESSGFQYVSKIEDGKIVGPFGERKSPSKAAAQVDRILRAEAPRELIRGKERPRDGGWSPSDWEWFTGDGWERLKQD